MCELSREVEKAVWTGILQEGNQHGFTYEILSVHKFKTAVLKQSPFPVFKEGERVSQKQDM